MLKKVRKIVVYVLCLLVVGGNRSIVYAQNQEETTYQVYDMETGSVQTCFFADVPSCDQDSVEGYFPNGIETIESGNDGISLMAVVGTDNRTVVSNTAIGPYCNTVFITASYNNGKTYRGSGFMIGPNAVCTAAHVVYSAADGGYPTSVTVVPAKNGTSEPYGSETISASANNLVVSSNYISNNGPDHDWAIVKLSSNLGNLTGWLGLKWQTASYNSTYVYNTGYPTVVNGIDVSSAHQMYVGTGVIMQSNTYTLKGTWDASGGNSGGPVFANYSGSGYTAIGILTSGSNDSTFGNHYPDAYSTATRITKQLYDLMVSYRE